MPGKYDKLEYWQAFREVLQEKSKIIKPRRPRPKHWMNFAIGHSKFRLTVFANTRDKRIGTGLVITGPHAKPHFHLLKQERQAIEQEFGTTLEWFELHNKKRSQIYLQRQGIDPGLREQWSEQHNWLLEKLETFHHVFAARVKALDAIHYDPDEDDEIDAND